MGRGMEKQIVKVGSTDSSSTVGETVSFTAERLGTANVNGGASGSGYDVTFYRLPDGTFRALVEHGTIAILHPSNMPEAMRNGQRNNYSYGRLTLEELKAERVYQIGEVFEAFMKKHPETIRNTVRDLA